MLTGLLHLLLQFAQHDVGLLPYQPPQLTGIDRARSPTLRNTLPCASTEFGRMDLPHPAVAHLEPYRQLPQSPLARAIRPKNLLSQIITVCSRHTCKITPKNNARKESRAIPQR